MPIIYGIALSDDQPAADVPVELVSGSGEVTQKTKTLTDGTFTFSVEAGSWTLRWTDGEGQTDEGEIEVAEDDAEVEIVI